MPALVPLSELPRQLADDVPIAWDVAPHLQVSNERLGLHVAAAQSVMNLAGISAMQFNATIGKLPETAIVVQPTGWGFGDGIVNLSGVARRTKTPRQSPTVEALPPDDVYKEWPAGYLQWPFRATLNRSQLGSDMAEMRSERGIDEAWAYALNYQVEVAYTSAIGKVLECRIGHERQAGRLTSAKAVDTASVVAMAAEVVYFAAADAPPMLAIAGGATFIGVHLLTLARQYRQLRSQDQTHSWRDRNWSLYASGAITPDRALLAAGQLLAAGPLIRTLPS